MLTCGPVRVVFHWREDRWAHRVEWLAEDGRVVPLLVSVEGSPAESWPPSPPLQELQTLESEREQAAREVLGIGMAGRSTWSLTCGPPGESAGSTGMRIETACRIRQSAGELGSTYRLVSDATFRHVAGDTLEVTRGIATVSLVGLAGPSWSTAIATPPTAVRLVPRLVPTRPGQDSSPTTVRWAYTIRPLGNAGTQ